MSRPPERALERDEFDEQLDFLDPLRAASEQFERFLVTVEHLEQMRGGADSPRILQAQLEGLLRTGECVFQPVFALTNVGDGDMYGRAFGQDFAGLFDELLG